LVERLPKEFGKFKSMLESDFQSKHAQAFFLSNNNPTEFNLQEFILTRKNHKNKPSIHLSQAYWHLTPLQVHLVGVEDTETEKYTMRVGRILIIKNMLVYLKSMMMLWRKGSTKVAIIYWQTQ